VIREIIFWGDYFISFYVQQDFKVRGKILYVLWMVQHTEQVPQKFLKCLKDSDGLYEIRISTTFKEIRILSFFDDKQLIVLVNCFLKKTRKTPKKEIELAQKLRREYFSYKNRNLK